MGLEGINDFFVAEHSTMTFLSGLDFPDKDFR